MIRILSEDSAHPLVGEALATLRDVQRQGDRERFRQTLRRLGWWMGYEIAKTLPKREVEVTTPLGTATETCLGEPPVLATILRAGLPMWDGFLDAFPDSDALLMGAARREGHPDPETGRLPIDIGYMSKTGIEGKTLIYVDPMLATGSTLLEVHPRVIASLGKPRRTIIAAAIAWRGALETTAQALDADLFVAAADDNLNELGYIVPGLGDAGDLAFGEAP